MNYSKFSVEDFVLDQKFRKWVLYPTPQSNLYWENWLVNHPNKVKEVTHARKIILNTTWEQSHFLEGEKEELWEAIEAATMKNEGGQENAVLPISSHSVVEKIYRMDRAQRKWGKQWAAVAAILVGAVFLAFLAAYFLPTNDTSPAVEQEEYAENTTAPGVKSRMKLPDGTKVVLNAGSRMWYLPNFSEGKREVYLEGEAYFDVAKDSSRPFIVHSGNISTKALGTAFNVRAFSGGKVQVALVEGLVEVEEKKKEEVPKIWLRPGNMITYDTHSEHMDLENFDPLTTIGWKDGVLVLKKASRNEVIETLERWYGVQVQTDLVHPKEWAYSGEFKNESLENVLTAIAYSMKFDFEIEQSTVRIF